MNIKNENTKNKISCTGEDFSLLIVIRAMGSKRQQQKSMVWGVMMAVCEEREEQLSNNISLTKNCGQATILDLTHGMTLFEISYIVSK